METQEFDSGIFLSGVNFVGPDSYRAATLLLAAKAFLSLLLGLTVTYAWVVLPQVTKATQVHAACAESGKAQAGMAAGGHPAAQMVLGPAGNQGSESQPGPCSNQFDSLLSLCTALQFTMCLYCIPSLGNKWHGPLCICCMRIYVCTFL